MAYAQIVMAIMMAATDAAAAEPSTAAPSGTRIKDIATIAGVGQHRLIGYGLIVGLDNTGDGMRSTFTVQSLANMLEQFGVTVSPTELRVTNVAAVVVTASLPAFVKVGSTLDVTVSSIGDAKSLGGGTLLLTPLQGLDGQIYAVAQGPVSIGGYNVAAGGERIRKNHPAVGRVPGGASVVRAVPDELPTVGLCLSLNLPDFTTASRIAAAINAELGRDAARALDAASVSVQVPQMDEFELVRLITRLESLPVRPDAAARVVINERTGTVVIGHNVRLLPAAVSHGSLEVQIREWPVIAQPAPLSAGETVVVPDTRVRAKEETGRLFEIPPQNTVGDLVTALNALGVSPRDLVAILQALKEAGALQGHLAIM